MAGDGDKKVTGGIGGIGLLIGLMVLFSLWLANSGPNAVNNQKISGEKKNQVGSSQIEKNNTNQTGNLQAQAEKRSPFFGQISIRASSVVTDSPNQEYITLYARNNKQPINIGGWILKNGRENKTYIVAGEAVKGQSVSVRIPEQGVVLYNPFNPSTNIQSPITLKAGERAVIVTGSIPTFDSIKINDNFKINRCLGYLEDRPINQSGSRYQFNPSLKYNCPTGRDLSNTGGLDDVCYNFVRSIGGCHQPTDIYDESKGYCLDRNCQLSSFCRNFVKEHFSPESCFNLYANTEGFVGPEWRIFLNRNWELWERQRETISLFDRQGLLVAEISY